MLHDLESKLLSIGGNVGTVHCVGHSLGGALATLAAEWLKKSKVVNSVDVKLYKGGDPSKFILQADIGGRILRAAKDGFGICAKGGGDNHKGAFCIASLLPAKPALSLNSFCH